MTIARGLEKGSKCLSCIGEEERQRATRIREFATDDGHSRLLVSLYELDERLRRSRQDGFIGLDLIDPPERENETAPLNSIAFASTGGDDVTFSLLATPSGSFNDGSRVVLTVPHASGSVWDRNFVVGESLYEFLCLGCVSGYDLLESLAYDWDAVVADLGEPDEDEDDPRAATTLREMRRNLDLSAWDCIEPRLTELQAGVRVLFKFSDEATSM
jgi:hypothetical protein